MKDAGATSKATEKAFGEIAGRLAADGAESGQMFGMRCLKASGKAFLGVFGDALVFKLRDEPHAAAVKLKGAELFDPSGRGRPMKEWVVVPRSHAKKWEEFANAAFEYLRSR